MEDYGTSVFSLDQISGTINSIRFDAQETGENAAFNLYWLKTANVPAVPSPEQVLVRSFESDNGISSVNMEAGDAVAHIDGSLVLQTGYDGTGADNDSVLINFETARSPYFMLEVNHSISSVADVTLYASVYSESGATGDSWETTLTLTTSSINEEFTVQLCQVSTIVLTVSSTAGTHDLSIQHLQICEDSDMTVSFDLDVPLTENGAGSYSYDGDWLVLEATSTSNYSVVIDWLSVPTTNYPYVSLRTEGDGNAVAYVDIHTSTSILSYDLNWTAGSLFNLTSIDDVIERIDIIVKSATQDSATLRVAQISMSPVPVMVMQRHEMIVDYDTASGRASLVFSEHLLSWEAGSLAMSDGAEMSTRCNTTIIDWTSEHMIIEQSTSTFSVKYTIWDDGYIGVIGDVGSAQLIWLSKEVADRYSDSISVVSDMQSTLVREPRWAALYGSSLGFGLLGLTGYSIEANLKQGWLGLEPTLTNNIVLAPLLEPRFEMAGGFEIDPNFYVMIEDLSSLSVLTEWYGEVEQIEVGMWDGVFDISYAVDEDFDSLGSWTVDKDLSTAEVLDVTSIMTFVGILNITMECTDSIGPQTLVMTLRFLDFKLSEYPFFALLLEGDGTLDIEVSVGFAGQSSASILDLDGLDTYEEKELNLVKLLGTTYATADVNNITMTVTETDTSEGAKMLLIDRLMVYGLQDWALIQDASALAVMSVTSVAVVSNDVLTIKSAENSEIKFRYKQISSFNTAYYRTMQYRSYVGYASTGSVSVKNASATYNLECSSMAWCVTEADLAVEAGVPSTATDVEIMLTVGDITEPNVDYGQVSFDWLRFVALFGSEYEWEEFEDDMVGESDPVTPWSPPFASPSMGPGMLLPSVGDPTPLVAYSQPSQQVPESGANTNYTKHGKMVDNGDGTKTYTTSLGQLNTWTGSEFVPYIWDDTNRIVYYANITMEFYDWYVVLKN
ncbi:MAG: hypothetical protein ACE5IO_07145, partial [Thermoplasmata archaeon]